MAAYRITARSLERQYVGELVLKEFASLEDVSEGEPAGPNVMSAPGKVVLVLEEDDSPHGGAPHRMK